jgi:geranylgeranyl diphosphate synthase type II
LNHADLASRAASLSSTPLADAGFLTREAWIDLRLRKVLPPPGSGPELLTHAVRDACLGQGKRVRPILAMLSAAHFGAREQAAVDFGCALELIHTASLILDDLPCMDDAAMRRGRPTFHRRFGEDTAVLAAVALLNHAQGLIARDRDIPPQTRLSLQTLVSDAVGFQGLVGGQLRDLRESGALRTEEALTSLNHQKTGVLFVAAAVGGAIIAGADKDAQERARLFASRLGLAFQLWDDLQDLTSTLEVMGKDARQDDDRITFVSLWGVERTRRAVDETLAEAVCALGDRDCPMASYALGLFRSAGYGG